MNITAVIMCSGLGRRMGKNKLLMDFKGRPMFQYVLDTVSSCGFYKAVVVTAYEEIAVYARNFDVVYNGENIEGISASIRLGTENAGDCDGIMFFTADQPFINGDTVFKLKEAFEKENKIIIPTVENIPKNPVIFPIRYKDDLILLKGEESGKNIYRCCEADIFRLSFYDNKPFLDIDTAKDLDDFKSM